MRSEKRLACCRRLPLALHKDHALQGLSGDQNVITNVGRWHIHLLLMWTMTIEATLCTFPQRFSPCFNGYAEVTQNVVERNGGNSLERPPPQESKKQANRKATHGVEFKHSLSSPCEATSIAIARLTTRTTGHTLIKCSDAVVYFLP